jgi:hypothetical protein
MAINLGGAYGKVVISTAEAQKNLKDASKAVDSFLGALKSGESGTNAFSNALSGGRVSLSSLVSSLKSGEGDMKAYTNQLLAAGKAAGLSERSLSRMASATGAFSKEQINAAWVSSAMTKKAEELARAVSQGAMTSREAGKAFADYAKQIGATGSQMSSMMAIFSKATAVLGGVAAAAGIVGTALKEAFDLGKQGAVVIQTKESWDQLLRTVGAAPDLLEKLRAASNNTIPDLQLMSSTATLLAGTSGDLAKNLANAAPELLEIAKAANKLNPSLGSVQYMYESLMTGIKRGQTNIIDNTGLYIKMGEANAKLASQLGKSVDKLTAEETKMAILNATLEAGQTLLDQVGGNTDSATDSITRMETAVTNAGNAIKGKFAPYVSNLADLLYLALTHADQVTAALELHEQQTYRTARGYDAYLQEMLRANVAAGRTKQAHMDALLLYRERGIAIDKQVKALGIMTDAEYNAAMSGEYLKASYEANAGAAREMTAATEEASDAVKNMDADLIAAGREGGLASARANAEAASWAFKEMTRREREAGEELQTLDDIAAGITFEDLGSDLSGGIATAIEGLQRDLAGGGRIAAMMEQTKQAVLSGAITKEEGMEYFAGLLVASEAIEVALGNKTQWEAERFVQDVLGLKPAEVKALFEDLESDATTAAEGVSGAFENLDAGGVAEKLADIKDAQAGMGEASDTTNPKLAEQAGQLDLIKEAAEGMPEILGGVTKSFTDMGSAMTSSGLMEGLRAFDGIGQEALDLAEGMEGFVLATQQAPELVRLTGEALVFLREEVNEAHKDIRDLWKEMNTLTASTALATSRVNLLRGALSALPSGKTITITVNVKQTGGTSLLGGNVIIPNLHDEGVGGPGGRAAGGPVLAGQPYIWNERGAGPEVLIPAGNGYVLNRQQAEAALTRAAAGAAGGGSGPGGAGAVNVQNVEQHFYSQGAAALGMAIVARERWSRLSQGMGQ